VSRARALLRRLLRLPAPRHAAGPPDAPPERPEPSPPPGRDAYWGETILDMRPPLPRPYVPPAGGAR
jgi:hypothetical protein